MSEITPLRLGNKYILLDLLGTGGMAEVFRGKLIGDKGFEKLIVIKQLFAHVAKEPELVEHFTGEARLAALLQHENIATIYDFGKADGHYFMAMEYLFGKDLQSVIQAANTDKSFSPQYALMITLKVCEAMGYAHSLADLQGKPLKIIHRDLTPHNIFLTYDGKVKIIDFGIAKTEMHDNKTRVGVVKGKITYMSPEQLSGDDLDSRSDIFSIGILLYEMLSGRRMYTGETAALIRKAITVDYERLESIVPGLDSVIYGILDKALTIDPADRYQSCEEMQLDIEKCLSTLSLGYDYRLLKTFMVNLFSREYQVEKAHGIKALQAARQFEAMSAGDSDKTLFFSPDINKGEKSESPGRKQKKSGILIDGRRLLPGIVILCSILFIYLMFFNKQAEPEKEVTAALQESVEQGDREVVITEAVLTSDKQGPAYQKRQTVERLLLQAENALAIGNLSVPAGTNAFFYYQEIERIDPGNHRVQDGFRRISDRYAELAEREIGKRQYAEAMRLVAKGMIVYPESDRLKAIQNRLDTERTKLINDLSRRAEEKIAENMLTTPADDCALKYYREIEAIDADNGLIKEGFRKIGDRYALLADSSFRQLDFDSARHFVSEGIDVDPDNYRLQILERELLKSTPEMIMKGVEKNLKSFF
jgi:serine/threonine protein kinase